MLKELYNPAQSVRFSRWITRGWTYQEGFMSRRKLFFTDQGVALHCKSMYYEEGVSRSLPDIDEIREDLIPWVMESVVPRSLSVGIHVIWNVIGEYTKREVTYEDDSLNACLGIFNHLGYKHLWGIVIREQPFSLELCWVVRDRGSPEQEAFPSWSWTRWRSMVTLYEQNHPSSIASIKTHLPSGEEFDIVRDTRYKGNLGAFCSGKILRITGTFLTSRFLVIEEKDGRVIPYSVFSCPCSVDIKMRASLDTGTGSIASTTAYLDGTELLEVTPLYKDEEGGFSGQFLLVKRHMDAYRRIGVALAGLIPRTRHVCGKLKDSEAGFVPVEGRHVRTIDLI